MPSPELDSCKGIPGQAELTLENAAKAEDPDRLNVLVQDALNLLESNASSLEQFNQWVDQVNQCNGDKRSLDKSVPIVHMDHAEPIGPDDSPKPDHKSSPI